MAIKLSRKKGKKTRTSARPRTPVTKQEVSALGQAIRSLGGAIGSAGGAMIGMPAAGGVVGNSLAGALSRWMGAGDYSIHSNSVAQRTLKAAASIPSMHNDAQTVVVRHKEYLGEILSSQTFVVQQSYPLNPGVSQTFPWLAGIASRFQEYKIRGLVFHYIPTSGSAVSATNAALGSVMLQTSYRATDAIPGSKVELLNEFCSNEVVPSDSMAHPIECDPKENPFNVQYIRTGSVPGNDSLLMYDLGQTHVAVSGCQTDGKVLGDLWVTYDIELKKPLVASNVTAGVVSASDTLTSGTVPTGVFGPLRTLSGITPIQVNNNTMIFPKGATGRFLVNIIISGNSLALTLSSFTVTGAAKVDYCNGTSGDTFSSLGSSTVVVVTSAVRITDPAVNATLVWGFGGTATLITSTRVIVTEVE